MHSELCDSFYTLFSFSRVTMSNIIESNDFNEEDETIIVTIRLLFKGKMLLFAIVP